ncbi:MAG: GEVED domain-containing protein [Halobacteriales archaeon]|nr:GEVED domain-containing protein [Halobacteriales archaeon]
MQDLADLRLSPGETPVVELRVTNETDLTARLVGWIDIDVDGVFSVGERAIASISPFTANGMVALSFPFVVPENLQGTTYARFRISTDPRVESPTGPVDDGEVEDHLVSIQNLDFGDAPDTSSDRRAGDYQSLASNNGPSHFVDPRIYLGYGVDAEPDSLQLFDNNGELAQRRSANGDDETVLVETHRFLVATSAHPALSE